MIFKCLNKWGCTMWYLGLWILGQNCLSLNPGPATLQLCKLLGKSSNLPVPLFPQLWNGNNSGLYLLELLWGLDKLIFVKGLGKSMGPNNLYILRLLIKIMDISLAPGPNSSPPPPSPSTKSSWMNIPDLFFFSISVLNICQLLLLILVLYGYINNFPQTL